MKFIKETFGAGWCVSKLSECMRNRTKLLSIRYVLHRASFRQPFNIIQAFSREAVLWGQLSHINVLPFYGICWLEDARHRLALVSPWMAHGNVNEFLKQNTDADRRLLVHFRIFSDQINLMKDSESKGYGCGCWYVISS